MLNSWFQGMKTMDAGQCNIEERRKCFQVTWCLGLWLKQVMAIPQNRLSRSPQTPTHSPHSLWWARAASSCKMVPLSWPSWRTSHQLAKQGFLLKRLEFEKEVLSADDSTCLGTVDWTSPTHCEAAQQKECRSSGTGRHRAEMRDGEGTALQF